MKINNFFKFIIAIVICELAGIIGAVFTAPAIPTWYATLAKPTLNPPSWVFGPVWTTLYFLMGVAFFLVWKQHSKIVEDVERLRKWKSAIAIFFFQLALNIFWSIIFFSWHNPGAAFLEIIFLWLAILFTIMAFFKISRSAAYLFLPYIFWVSFAVYLNYAIWVLN